MEEHGGYSDQNKETWYESLMMAEAVTGNDHRSKLKMKLVTNAQ